MLLFFLTFCNVRLHLFEDSEIIIIILFFIIVSFAEFLLLHIEGT